MLQQTSQDFRKLFLLLFTKELIKNSEINPKKIIPHPVPIEKRIMPKPFKQKVKEIIQKTEKVIKRPLEKRDLRSPIKKPLIRKANQKPRPRTLRMPAPKLPQRLQYLKPTATKKQIDLGKLNSLLKDPAVKDIECYGPDTNVVVRGFMGTKNTNIILTKEEISQIIKKFEEESKIPVQEGVYRVVAGKMNFSAIISTITGSKFIIKKMKYRPEPQKTK
jgi:hypothetical protein